MASAETSAGITFDPHSVDSTAPDKFLRSWDIEIDGQMLPDPKGFKMSDYIGDISFNVGKEYTKEERTAQICQLIRKMGYPEEFGYALAEELETENAMRRMVGYLLSADHPRMEDIADEALAIIEMNQHWKEKKIREYEHARYLNENRRR